MIQKFLLELSETPTPKVLIIGSGQGGVGCELLDELDHICQINLDIYPYPGIDLLADAHSLPLPDNSQDGIIIQAVLEHVLSPNQVIKEIERVLKPNGLIYSETPFMQMVHEKQFDYTRYTDLGHRYLFRNFEQIDRAITGGPGMTLLWAWCYFLRSFFNTWVGCQFGFAVGRLTGFWLLWIDLLLVRMNHPAAYDAASGYGFLGRKKIGPSLTQRDLIKTFRGFK